MTRFRGARERVRVLRGLSGEGLGRSLAQGKLPGVYVEDPSLDI